MKQGKAFIGKDGFWHKVFDLQDYILADQFHYRNTAIKEAEAYKRNGKTVKVAKAPGQLYGIWMLEGESP